MATCQLGCSSYAHPNLLPGHGFTFQHGVVRDWNDMERIWQVAIFIGNFQAHN